MRPGAGALMIPEQVNGNSMDNLACPAAILELSDRFAANHADLDLDDVFLP